MPWTVELVQHRNLAQDQYTVTNVLYSFAYIDCQMMKFLNIYYLDKIDQLISV